MAVTLNPITAALRMFAALRARLSDPQRGRYQLGMTVAGVRVTHESAEQVAAVWACMDVIASALSSSDWNVYQGVRAASNKQDLPEDSLQYILNTRFNPEMTAQAGKRALMLAAVGYGTGYAEIQTDMAGRITALWPIHPARVDPRRDLETGRLFYRVTQEWGGGWVDMDPDELYIVRGASLTGFAGDDFIARAIRSVAIALALDEFSATYFGNGAQVGGTLEVAGKLDDPAYQRLKGQFDQKHSGVRNAWRPMIVEGGTKWTPPQVDAEKAQVMNLKYVSVEEICRWFRVPPHKIAHLARATNNNIEHQGLEFSRDTLRPWKVEIEQEADYKLVPWRVNKFIEIDVDWAEQGGYKDRMEAYAKAISCGVFSPNDVLRKLGENTIGNDGDIHFVNGAAIPLDRIGDAYNAAPSPATSDSPPDDGAEQVARAWVAHALTRIAARQQKRGRDLQRTGEQAAELQAYAQRELAEVQRGLQARWPNARTHLDALLQNVLDGMAPSAAADQIFDRIKETTA